MSDHGDEEDRRLLDEPSPSHEYDVETKSPPGRPAASSIWTTLGFVLVVMLLAMPLLGYVRHLASASPPRPSVKQLAIALDPEKHVSRSAATREFHWNVTLGAMAPDGVEKQVYLVNGAFPGPTIEARSGDRIVVHVHNNLADQGLAIHWHGLQMKGFNSMDGAIGFTQCPIAAGRDFKYDFKLGDHEHGTFWWHSHADVQRGDGLYGGFIVHQPGLRPKHKEALLLVGDWFHRKQTDVFNWYFDWGSVGNEPVPDSLLVNGRGRYNCSMAVPARPVVCAELSSEQLLPLLHRKPKDAVKLRVVNTGTVAGLSLKADGATMQPIAVDGGFAVEGQPGRSVGVLYPGERVDLLVSWDGVDEQNHQFHVELDDENFGGFPNPALDPNHSFRVFPPSPRTRQENSPAILSPDCQDRLLANLTAASATSTDQLPLKAQETMVLYLKTQMLSRFQNKPMGFVNNTSWEPQNPPLLATDRSLWDANQFIPFINSSSTRDVDIVINNLDDGAHPIHLHGYSFYVLSSYRAEGRDGWGSYNPFESRPPVPLNLVNPVRKDTVSVPRRGHAVIRVRADNPGVWMMHCHMLVHMATGMVTGLHVEDEEKHHPKQTSTIDSKPFSQIAIVGVGAVSGAAAFALVISSIARELLLVDINTTLRDAQVRHLSDVAYSSNGATRVRAATHHKAGQCDIAIITAASKRVLGTSLTSEKHPIALWLTQHGVDSGS
ncbi:Multicopper oxidase family protein [Metarhizium album ARSEF 1941]|uniref:Laccase 1 n=1 Tax=Metarhizium album (strain ARSEF 1941) TaxID=1081103 RepID=A0A0B2X4L6_METAS|nr:Multicopper oxidase family protein [Metarhizium album ARSEF 1941]KHO00390.1 Multicopper oxidase family protein [Metarhizium album ARSEF 1941]